MSIIFFIRRSSTSRHIICLKYTHLSKKFFLAILLLPFYTKAQNPEISLLAKIDSLEKTWYAKNNTCTPPTTSQTPSHSFELASAILPSGSLNGIDCYLNQIDITIQSLRKDRGFLLAKSLGKQYASHIMPLIQEKNLPEFLQYLPLVLSAYNPHYVGKQGGGGIWQLNYLLAKKYGLKVSKYIDERRDIAKSSRVALSYLTDLYYQYKDWYLTIGAFVCGRAGIHRAQLRTHNEHDYWQLHAYLPENQRDMMIELLAVVHLIYKENLPEWEQVASESPDTLHTSKLTNLRAVAKGLSVPLAQLQIYNPLYRENITPKNEILYLPRGRGEDFQTKKAIIYQWQDSLQEHQKQQKPRRVAHSFNKIKIYYTVRAGDNLGRIASEFHVSISNLKYWNSISNHIIRVGEELAIYVPKTKLAYYKSVVNEKLLKSNQKLDTQPKKQINQKSIYYRVKKGDTLWSIARNFEGVSDEDIRRLNGMRNSLIYEGQQLKIK